jgi:hypothetical protein
MLYGVYSDEIILKEVSFGMMMKLITCKCLRGVHTAITLERKINFGFDAQDVGVFVRS